ncbi:uncharacterized protein LOC106155074 [Lingula anatina]|uniref:Uncharacterized protein LOC106155074 n=1 Tax=Lingula anatina TaxID=7574 RepID=A0A1S3HGJ7_LINAN|nr:uncharacterized protein LOC106155074 [Lingula anatina]|eukprot:XP_013385208.1 uncharacterized protein LOC106155074 [Lingula anatina]
MNVLCILSLCLIVCDQVNGHFLFGSSPTIYPSEDVNPMCEQNARDGDCEFWNCFHARWRCSRDHNFSEEYGKRLCQRLKQYYDSFDDEGKQFADESTKCLMGKFLSKYRADSNQCYALEQYGEKMLAECNANRGFCTAIKNNMDTLKRVYHPRDLIQLGRTLTQCARNELSKKLSVILPIIHGKK